MSILVAYFVDGWVYRVVDDRERNDSDGIVLGINWLKKLYSVLGGSFLYG